MVILLHMCSRKFLSYFAIMFNIYLSNIIYTHLFNWLNMFAFINSETRELGIWFGSIHLNSIDFDLIRFIRMKSKFFSFFLIFCKVLMIRFDRIELATYRSIEKNAKKIKNRNLFGRTFSAFLISVRFDLIGVKFGDF